MGGNQVIRDVPLKEILRPLFLPAFFLRLPPGEESTFSYALCATSPQINGDKPSCSEPLKLNTTPMNLSCFQIDCLVMEN